MEKVCLGCGSRENISDITDGWGASPIYYCEGCLVESWEKYVGNTDTVKTLILSD
jgi:hypothetical protein